MKDEGCGKLPLSFPRNHMHEVDLSSLGKLREQVICQHLLCAGKAVVEILLGNERVV